MGRSTASISRWVAGGLAVAALAWAALAGATVATTAAGPVGEAATPTAAAAKVAVLTIAGAIGPATADYFGRGLGEAQARGAALVVLELDTPGGLDTAMRQIIRDILGSPIPVAVFVAPSGARAASAGTYMLYASHVAAMAPATNLGAATPVAIGIGGPQPGPLPGPKAAPDQPADGKGKDKAPRGAPADTGGGQDALTQKRIHDASAYIRGLAQLRGRDAEWAERAVREAVSLSAKEALARKVIDVVANDVPDLLRQIDGMKVSVTTGALTLRTAGASTFAIDPDWRVRLLAVITDPSIAFILMLVGIYGLVFEFANPGFGLPGVVGGISLLLALFAFQLLPISYAGLGLIGLGIAMMIGEAFVPSFVLGTGGVVAFAIGAVMLIDTDVAGYGVPMGLVVPLAVGTALVLFAVVSFALKARRRPVVSGREAILGASGVVMEDFVGAGWARIEGEQWRVVSPTAMLRGQRVRVVGIDGLTLAVKPEGETP